jgi:ubiquitin carboxyl-terminal hydrolase L3
LFYPTTPEYEAKKAVAEALREEYLGNDGQAEPVVWFRQMINNACGLYAALHAVCNTPSRFYFGRCLLCAWFHILFGSD